MRAVVARSGPTGVTLVVQLSSNRAKGIPEGALVKLTENRTCVWVKADGEKAVPCHMTDDIYPGSWVRVSPYGRTFQVQALQVQVIGDEFPRGLNEVHPTEPKPLAVGDRVIVRSRGLPGTLVYLDDRVGVVVYPQNERGPAWSENVSREYLIHAS